MGINGCDEGFTPGVGAATEGRSFDQAIAASRSYLMFDWDDFPVILGQGAVHDLSDGDPRNPKLAGLRSVSYAGAVGLAKREKPKARVIGFHKPKRS